MFDKVILEPTVLEASIYTHAYVYVLILYYIIYEFNWSYPRQGIGLFPEATGLPNKNPSLGV